jgi:CubicO group peptidase (beta-lactamase class C family)
VLSRRELLRAGIGFGAALTGCSSSAPASPGAELAPSASSTTTSLVTTPPPIVPAAPTTDAGRWRSAELAALDEFVAGTGGRALLIADGGRVVHQWHLDEDLGYRRDVASVQKSIVALLVGRAVEDGLLDLDTRIAEILGPSWVPSADAPDVTVRQLLSMTSGLDHRLRVIAAPGTTWQYSNAFARLADVLEAVTSMQLDDLARTWLFDPVGAATAEFRHRPAASRSVAGFGLVASAADLAAVGALVVAHGAPVVSPSWVDLATTPSQAFNPSYGLLWWLNGEDAYRLPGPDPPLHSGPLVPSAPPDLVAALGKDDQKLYVSPDLELVVVRLGERADVAGADALSSFDDLLWQRLLAAHG